MDFHGQMPDHRNERATEKKAQDNSDKESIMPKKTTPKLNQNKMDPATFGAALGQAVWLMSMSETHKERPIKMIEAEVLPAILMQQFKIYSKNNRPVAFLTWAAVNDKVKARIEGGDKNLSLADWRCGNNITIVDCVSPFNPTEVFEQEFLKNLKEVG